MGTAYTPGLEVTRSAIVRKERRLPLKGKVLVKVGDEVTPETIVARTELPGDLQIIKVSAQLSLDAEEFGKAVKVQEGQPIKEGDVVAELKTFFGLFSAKVKSSTTGTVEFVTPTTGNVGVRKPPIPVEVDGYISGKVVEVVPDEGVLVETHGALVQGIFGIGGERRGRIKVVVADANDELTIDKLPADCTGLVLIGGSLVRADVLRETAKRGAKGVVTGGIIDDDVAEYLGYDIGVAITGHENIPQTVIVTEGFGQLAMANRTFDMLKTLEGKMASINGATQIRAGALRPEIIVPLPPEERKSGKEHLAGGAHELAIGTRIRIIRVPYFGKLAKVTGLPHELQTLESGSHVRILEAELDNGEKARVPRANVEILE